jgi:trehalose 6-phosphate phosphatase
MRHLLSRASRTVLTRLAQENSLFGFDFDELYPCVIVSGRARADLLPKLDGIKVASIIGNHGAETAEPTNESRPVVERWIATLEDKLGPSPGLWMEDKGLSLALHYRQAADKARTRRRVLAATRNLADVRIIGGKQVVNLTIEQSPDKGDALTTERMRLRCDWVFYVGDDENDEDAFALGGKVVPVRIGRKQRSHARYYLRTQSEIDDLLDVMIRLRTPGARAVTTRSLAGSSRSS